MTLDRSSQTRRHSRCSGVCGPELSLFLGSFGVPGVVAVLLPLLVLIVVGLSRPRLVAMPLLLIVLGTPPFAVIWLRPVRTTFLALL